jgi:hypothetical protein
MSGQAVSPLTDAERNDVRRFCGYPAYGADGTNASLFVFSVRFRTLEYRMAWLTDAEVATVRVRLAELNTLETAIPGAGANLDTAKAAVWTHNRHEVRDRLALFRTWGRWLAQFMGIPPGPALSGQNMVVI